MAGTTEPFESVFSSLEVMEVMARAEVVALVVVEFNPVKFCSVVEPLDRRVEKVPRPVEVRSPPFAVVK